MCVEFAFIYVLGRIYHSSSCSSHSEIRSAWGLPHEGAECEWEDGSEGTHLRVRHTDRDIGSSIRREILVRWPTRLDLFTWLDGQATRDQWGRPDVLVLRGGVLLTRCKIMADRRQDNRHTRQVWREMRKRVYLLRRSKGMSLRQLAAAGHADLLAHRLRLAPWGRQSDGCFVDQYSASIGARHRHITLHLPGNGGMVASMIEYADRATLVSEMEARAKRVKERAERAAWQALYIERLDVAAEMLMAGASFNFYPGQKGGFFKVGSHRLSANGVLRRVRGIIPPELPCDGGLYRLYDIDPSELHGYRLRGAAAIAAEEY